MSIFYYRFIAHTLFIDVYFDDQIAFTFWIDLLLLDFPTLIDHKSRWKNHFITHRPVWKSVLIQIAVVFISFAFWFFFYFCCCWDEQSVFWKFLLKVFRKIPFLKLEFDQRGQIVYIFKLFLLLEKLPKVDEKQNRKKLFRTWNSFRK